MKYYKLIQNDNIVGVVSSNDFIRYSPATDMFLCCDEQQGEYASFNGILYRDTWMQPIRLLLTYTQVLMINTTKEEYDILLEALKRNEEISYEREETEPEPVIPYINPSDIDTLEFIRSSKLNEISSICRTTIEAGFDFIIRGESKHFSLTTQDQLNLMSLSAMTQTQSLIPYHADGEECTFYTAEEINQIIDAANSFKNYQIAYHNALKAYINDLDTIEDIAAIEYGTPIPDEYKSDVLKILE